jgi:GTP-binding protein HflX
LKEIGLHEKPMLTAINKADELGDVGDGLEPPPDPDTVIVSARTGLGLDALRARIEAKINEGTPWVAALIPYGRTDLVDMFHRRGQPARVTYQADGTEIEGRLPSRFVERLRPYLLSRDPLLLPQTPATDGGLSQRASGA